MLLMIITNFKIRGKIYNDLQLLLTPIYVEVLINNIRGESICIFKFTSISNSMIQSKTLKLTHCSIDFRVKIHQFDALEICELFVLGVERVNRC